MAWKKKLDTQLVFRTAELHNSKQYNSDSDYILPLVKTYQKWKQVAFKRSGTSVIIAVIVKEKKNSVTINYETS